MQNVERMVRHAAELLTLAGPQRARSGEEMSRLEIISDGALAITAGKIVAVGSDAELAAAYSAEKTINATGKVVMPGFIDAHTHPIFVHTRENEFEMRLLGKSYVEITLAGGGINASIQAVREASVDELVQLAIPRLQRMLVQGTTTVEAKSGYGLTTESEIRMLQAIRRLSATLPLDIVPTFMGAHEFPQEYKNDHAAYIRSLCEEMLPEVVRLGLAEYCDIFTEKHVYSLPETRTVMERAKQLGLHLRMHADEIEPIGGSELAAELGAISADHLGAISDTGIAALAKSGTIATLLPATIFSLGLPAYAPARKMIAAGVPVALATDYNPGSCNCDDMQTVISIACLQMQMTPAEAIVASTINAAWALERGDRIGSLEPGKQADVLIMNMPSYRYLPYHIGYNDVETVVRRGQVVYQAPDLAYPLGR